MGNGPPGFVIAAFAATWLVIVGYLIWLRVAMKRARAHYEQAGGTQ